MEKEYKFGRIGEAQVNLFMAHDINTDIPLLSWNCQGGSQGKASVRHLFGQVPMKNMLFVVDRGKREIRTGRSS